MSDRECLDKFLEMLGERVGITTSFITSDDGNLTHQILQIRCGDLVSVSEPQPLQYPLRLATAEEQGFTLN